VEGGAPSTGAANVPRGADRARPAAPRASGSLQRRVVGQSMRSTRRRRGRGRRRRLHPPRAPNCSPACARGGAGGQERLRPALLPHSRLAEPSNTALCPPRSVAPWSSTAQTPRAARFPSVPRLPEAFKAISDLSRDPATRKRPLTGQPEVSRSRPHPGPSPQAPRLASSGLKMKKDMTQGNRARTLELLLQVRAAAGAGAAPPPPRCALRRAAPLE
jgi:hypothetical protein